MSLRADIHFAIDEVSASRFGMPERVIESVLANQRRRRRWSIRLRAPISLVAVFVLVALMAGLALAGRLWLESSTSIGHQPPIHSADLKSLESRPLNLPLLNPEDECAGGPITQGMLGAGPTYAEFGIGPTTSWGAYWNADAVTDANLTGPILIRGRDLRTGKPVVFVGLYAAGPVVGSDTVDGSRVQQRAELVLDPSQAPIHALGVRQITWGFVAGLPGGPGHCAGWQVDSRDSSETFVANFPR